MGGFFEEYLRILFVVHDRLFSFFSKRLKLARMVILVIAHLSLLGFFFPELRREFGSLAGNLLIFILFLSPLAAVSGMPILRLAMGIRRELGIFMGYLAGVHGLGYIIDPVFFESYLRPHLSFGTIFEMTPMILFGIVALLLTIPLLLTSNTLLFRALGGARWKRLHILAYPLFLFAVLHRFASSSGTIETAINAFSAAVLLGAYGLLKYMAWKRDSFPLFRKPMRLIGEKYEVISKR